MKKNHQILLIVLACVAGLVLFINQAVRMFGAFGGGSEFDQMFGQQHLNTTVALLELHRTRTGSYPLKLQEIEFTGAWDPIHLGAMKYCPSADRAKYYLEVSRGWMAKPSLDVPDRFWKGTGYEPSLAANCQ